MLHSFVPLQTSMSVSWWTVAKSRSASTRPGHTSAIAKRVIGEKVDNEIASVREVGSANKRRTYT